MNTRSQRLIIILATGIATIFLVARLWHNHKAMSYLVRYENSLEAAYCKEMMKKCSPTNEERSSILTKKPKYMPKLDEDWGKLKCAFTELSKDGENMYDYINEMTLSCESPVMVGGHVGPATKSRKAFFDGAKWICIDDAFNFTHKDCNALSFGISNDWSFDDALDKVWGCKVYAFDPTNGQKDHNRSPNIKFFSLGISDKPGNLGRGKLETYSTILKMLKMENAVIDYLKMDVEGAEWAFFKDVLTNTPNLLKKVKQIGMEIHLGLGADRATSWHHMQHLDCLGFKLMFMHNHPFLPKKKVNGKWRANLFELVWGQERNW